MQIRISTRHVALTPDLAVDADQQIRRATSRLARRVSSVAVRLFDLNGPRGGIDKVCEVTVSLGRAGTVRYRAVADSAATATRRAVSGVRQAVARQIALRRNMRRREARRRRGQLAGNPA